MTTIGAAAVAGAALLPASVMHSGPVRVLAAFVTINTVMYCALAVATMLPRLHPSTWLPTSNRRAQERSIHPAGWEPGTDGGGPVHRHAAVPVPDPRSGPTAHGPA